MKLYQELAEYYFSIENKHRNIFKDIELIEALLKDIDSPSLLDLGCGTGEHLCYLQKSGIKSVGIDSSYSMNRIAKLRFPDSAEFIREDMRDINYINQFNIVISLFGSFDYLIEDADVDKVLSCANRALKKDGICLFEIWNSYPIEKIREKPLSKISVTKHDNITIERDRGFRLLNYPDRTIVEVSYQYTLLPQNEIIKDKHIMRAYTKDEIEQIIKRNGFELINLYANSQKELYRETSNRIIIHFKKV